MNKFCLRCKCRVFSKIDEVDDDDDERLFVPQTLHTPLLSFVLSMTAYRCFLHLLSKNNVDVRRLLILRVVMTEYKHFFLLAYNYLYNVHSLCITSFEYIFTHVNIVTNRSHHTMFPT